MKTFTFKTNYNTYYDCHLEVDSYCFSGTVAITIVNEEYGPIEVFTTCLGGYDISDNWGFVDDNNCPEAIDLIEKLGLGEPTGIIAPSGFCFYPLYAFNMDKVLEYGADRRKPFIPIWKRK